MQLWMREHILDWDRYQRICQGGIGKQIKDEGKLHWEIRSAILFRSFDLATRITPIKLRWANIFVTHSGRLYHSTPIL